MHVTRKKAIFVPLPFIGAFKLCQHWSFKSRDFVYWLAETLQMPMGCCIKQSVCSQCVQSVYTVSVSSQCTVSVQCAVSVVSVQCTVSMYSQCTVSVYSQCIQSV